MRGTPAGAARPRGRTRLPRMALAGGAWIPAFAGMTEGTGPVPSPRERAGVRGRTPARLRLRSPLPRRERVRVRGTPAGPEGALRALPLTPRPPPRGGREPEPDPLTPRPLPRGEGTGRGEETGAGAARPGQAPAGDEPAAHPAQNPHTTPAAPRSQSGSCWGGVGGNPPLPSGRQPTPSLQTGVARTARGAAPELTRGRPRALLPMCRALPSGARGVPCASRQAREEGQASSGTGRRDGASGVSPA